MQSLLGLAAALAVAGSTGVGATPVGRASVAPSSPISFVPAASLSGNVAAASILGNDCAVSYGVYPTWDPATRELVPWLAYRASEDGACAMTAAAQPSDVRTLALESQATSQSVEDGSIRFWVSQAATQASLAVEDPCDWSRRLSQSLRSDKQPANAVCSQGSAGLVESTDSENGQLVFQKRGGDLQETVQMPQLLSLWKEYALLSLPNTAAGREAAASIDKWLPADTHVARFEAQPSQSVRDLAARINGGALSGQENKEPDFGRVEYNPLVSLLLQDSELSKEKLRATVETVSGEDQRAAREAMGNFKSWDGRHSATIGARNAAKWILSEMQDSVRNIPGAKCKLWEYDTYYAPNVVCDLPAGEDAAAEGDGDDGYVIISAHYDSRGTFGNVTAPGADDDGSGTSALLSVARVLGSKSVRFGRPVQLLFFSGEEQGLVGSKAYARHLKDKNVPVHFMLQIDMIAYRVEGEPLQMAFPDKLSTTTATKHIMDIAQLYVPELVTGYTPACCSDHQSFWELGYASSWVFEKNGPIADPMYHNSGDISRRKGYDYAQLQATSRVILATLLTRGRFYL